MQATAIHVDSFNFSVSLGKLEPASLDRAWSRAKGEYQVYRILRPQRCLMMERLSPETFKELIAIFMGNPM
jgi:hypothetical protein